MNDSVGLLNETKIKPWLVSFSRLFVLQLSNQRMSRVQWAHKMFQLSLPDQPWTFETQLFSIVQSLPKEKILTVPFKHLDKGLCTLQQQVQKMQLSSIHTTTSFHNCNDFFNSFFIYGQQFSKQFF